MEDINMDLHETGCGLCWSGSGQSPVWTKWRIPQPVELIHLFQGLCSMDAIKVQRSVPRNIEHKWTHITMHDTAKVYEGIRWFLR
jgi:hypothetical protein